ncbi:unnamed protein product, partial [Prorocentrum cordatum]
MMAAGGATGGRQETATSRQQRRAWARASADRLVQRLTAQVEELSAGLDAALEALDAVTERDGLADRLAACAPALVALLAGRSPTALQRLRRNVAMHAARVPGNLCCAPAAALRQAARGPRLGAVAAADRAGEDVESDFKVEICVDELGAACRRSAVPREVPNPGADVHALLGWLAADCASTEEKQVVGQFDFESGRAGHVLMPLAPRMWLPLETLPHAEAFVEGLEAGWRLAERRAAAGGKEDVDAPNGETNEDDDELQGVSEEVCELDDDDGGELDEGSSCVELDAMSESELESDFEVERTVPLEGLHVQQTPKAQRWAMALARAKVEPHDTVDAKLEPDVSFCTELRMVKLECTVKQTPKRKRPASAKLESHETGDAKLWPDASFCTELRTVKLESTERLGAQLCSNIRPLLEIG